MSLKEKKEKISITVENLIELLRPTLTINLINNRGEILSSFVKVAYRLQYAGYAVNDIIYSDSDHLNIFIQAQDNKD